MSGCAATGSRRSGRSSPGALFTDDVRLSVAAWRRHVRRIPTKERPMPAKLAQYLGLLNDKKAFAHLATLMPDGSPQVTPVWFDYVGGAIRVNSARGRGKDGNLKEGGA